MPKLPSHQSAHESAVATFGPALARIWRGISFSLVFVGFLSLAFTGEVHPVAILLFMVCWGFGLFFPIPPQWIPPWGTQVLLWGSLSLIGLLALQGRFESVIYLVLFISLAKCLSLRHSIDHIHVLLMAFFMLLATSVITNSITFMLFLFCFIVLSTLALICFTMGREVELALSHTTHNLPGTTQTRAVVPFEVDPTQPAEASHGLHGATAFSARALFLPLLFNGMMSTLFVLLLALGIFFIVPHHSTNSVSGLWAKPKPATRATSGYQDEITMDSISRINLDHTEVMRVAAAWKNTENQAPLPSSLRLRGTSLSYYNESQWRSVTQNAEMNSSYTWNLFNMKIPTAIVGDELVLTIRQNINLASRIFAASYPILIDLPRDPNFGRSFDWKEQAVKLEIPAETQLPIGSHAYPAYSAVSMVLPEAASILRELGAEIRREQERTPGINPEQIVSQIYPPAPKGTEDELTMKAYDRALYQQLPNTPLMIRIRHLAEEKAPAHDAPNKITQLLDWFQRDFTYTFTPETEEGMHPLESFLFATHKGHCEYFASALTLMLRSRDIPARIVSGYYTTERDLLEQSYVVKQSDAHAWTEVWLDGYGWLTIDPTPTAYRGSALYEQTTPSVWRRAWDSIRVFWQQYILDFSQAKQETMKNNLLNSPIWVEMLQKLKGLAMAMGTLPMGDTEFGLTGEWDRQSFWRYGRLLIGAGVLVMLLILYRQVRRRQRRPGVGRSPVSFMNQLVRALERQGFARQPQQTPAEWIAAVEQAAPGRWDLLWLVEVYHRHRFGQEALQPDEVARIRALIRSLD